MADGALDDQPELEPGVASPSSSIICEDDLSCPRPRYMLDGVFLGDDATDDFGLDAYEPRFFLPILDWIDQGVFSIELTFDDANVGQDFFYFCHVSTKYIASTPALAIRAHRCTLCRSINSCRAASKCWMRLGHLSSQRILPRFLTNTTNQASLIERVTLLD